MSYFYVLWSMGSRLPKVEFISTLLAITLLVACHGTFKIMGFIPHVTFKRFVSICVTLTCATFKTIAVHTSLDNPPQTRSGHYGKTRSAAR